MFNYISYSVLAIVYSLIILLSIVYSKSYGIRYFMIYTTECVSHVFTGCMLTVLACLISYSLVLQHANYIMSKSHIDA